MKRVLSILLLPCFVSIAAADEPLFHSAWRTFDVGNDVRPVTVDFGDVDGDGDRDAILALEFFANPGISVLLSNGDGTFAPEQIYDLVDIVGDARLTDMDADGDLDIIATIPGNAGTDFRIAVVRNNGDGTFGNVEYSFVGYGPYGMVVADFSGDGNPDVAVTLDGFPGEAVSVLIHNGNSGPAAGFLDPVEFETGPNSRQVEAADVDNDGDIDLAVGRGDFANSGAHGVSILFNDGSGDFGGLTHYGDLPDAFRDSTAVHLVDVDLDGDPDLVQGAGKNDFIPNTLIGVRLNDGSGGFGSPQVFEGPPGSYTPWFITSADFNGDGWPDIAASIGDGRDDDGFLIYYSDTLGGFFDVEFHRAGKWTKDIQAEDVDDDGDVDMITVASFSAAITVHENPGDGQFFAPPTYFVTDIIRDIKGADFDIDSDIDLIVAGFPIIGDPGVYVMRNAGDGTFTREVLAEGISVGFIEIVDLSGDGCPDLLMSPYLNSGFGFWVAISDCDGWFEPIATYQGGPGQGAGVAAVDVNNDGALDVILPNSGSNRKFLVFQNGGDGRSFTLVNQVGDDISQPGVDAADLNHDGNMDVIVSTFGGLAAFLGNGDFTFDGPFPSGQFLSSFELAQIDSDGEFDLAGFTSGNFTFTNSFGVMAGYGDGGFAFPSTYAAATDFEFFMDELTTFDLNGDGFDDVITSNGPSSDVSVFFSNGDGTLQPHDGHRYGFGYNASDAVVADFDEDGMLDIACSVNYGDVAVLFGMAGSSKGQTVAADSYSVIRGSYVSGELADSFASDDSYLRFGHAKTSSPTDPPVYLEFAGVLPGPNPTTLSVTLESLADTTGLAVTIEMFNWSSKSYDQVDVQTAAITDATTEVDITGNIADFVQPGTGAVKTRVGWRQMSPVWHYPWSVSIDQMVWIVNQDN